MDFFSILMFGPSLLAHAMPAAPFAIAGSLAGVQAILTLSGRAPPGRSFFRMPPLFAGVLWLVFGLYELQVQAWEARIDSPLRIDLMVWVPVLYVFSVLAAISAWRQARGMREPPAQQGPPPD